MTREIQTQNFEIDWLWEEEICNEDLETSEYVERSTLIEVDAEREGFGWEFEFTVTGGDSLTDYEYERVEYYLTNSNCF